MIEAEGLKAGLGRAFGLIDDRRELIGCRFFTEDGQIENRSWNQSEWEHRQTDIAS